MATHLLVVQHDNNVYRGTVRDPNGALVNLSGKTLRFMIKRSLTDADTAALVSKATGSGITHIDATNGGYELELTPTDIATLSHGETLLFALKLIDSGKAFTAESGTINVVKSLIEATT